MCIDGVFQLVLSMGGVQWYYVYIYMYICESEPAMELIKLVGRTEAGAIFEEVLEAQKAWLRQRLLKVNPSQRERAQPRKRYA